MDLNTPQVMGILNVTPDSFYSGSRKQTEEEIANRANQIIAEGGSIIDIGAFSTRPGADEVSEEEEGRRLKFALDIVRREQPDAAVSVDTYRPTLARKCIEEWGADIINDVSEGGITGIAHYNNTFINCHSSGNVTLKSANDAGDELEIGGIAGVWHNENGTTVTISGCSYTGTLSSKNVNTGVVTDFANNGLVGRQYSASGTGTLIIN